MNLLVTKELALNSVILGHFAVLFRQMLMDNHFCAAICALS